MSGCGAIGATTTQDTSLFVGGNGFDDRVRDRRLDDDVPDHLAERDEFFDVGVDRVAVGVATRSLPRASAFSFRSALESVGFS